MSCKLSRRARTFSANSTALVSWKVYTTDSTKDEINCTYISHCWRSISSSTGQNQGFSRVINELNEWLCASHHGRSSSPFLNSTTPGTLLSRKLSLCRFGKPSEFPFFVQRVRLRTVYSPLAKGHVTMASTNTSIDCTQVSSLPYSCSLHGGS